MYWFPMLSTQLTKTGRPKQQEVIQGIAITWVDVMGSPLNTG